MGVLMGGDVVTPGGAAPGNERTFLQIIGRVASHTGTKPFLGTASDGHDYWCKRVDSDHDFQAAVNEVAASVVGECLKAHVRPWKMIYVPNSLVGQFVGSGNARYRLTGKPLFGSRNLPAGRLHQDFQTIPSPGKDDNYAHIPKLIALWLLCNVQEDLQILRDASDDDSLWSIDHGFWFDSFPRPWQLSHLDQPGGRPRIPLI